MGGAQSSSKKKSSSSSSPTSTTSSTTTTANSWLPSNIKHRKEARDDLHVWPLDKHNAALLNQVHPRNYNHKVPHDEYDLIALGAGAGGLVSSRQSGRRGAKSAMISAHLAGGDCLNVGCVPSKAVLRAAKAVAEIRQCAEFGVQLPGGASEKQQHNPKQSFQLDFVTVMRRLRQKRATIAPADGHAGTVQAGAHVFQGHGKFTSPNTIQVGDNGPILKFKKAVVATGGRPTLPNVPGLADAPYTTNETLFNLETLPPRMVVLGAGVISLEMAQAFALFGSSVTVVQRTAQLFQSKHGDPEGAAILQQQLEKSGVTFVTGKTKQVTTLQERGNSSTNSNQQQQLPLLSVTVETADDGGSIEELLCECLLVATGRAANVENIGLEAAGVDFDPAKGVLVNDLAQSVSNPNVYAVGDCVADVPRLTHMSGEMAKLVVQNALFGDDWKLSSLVVPAVAYTEPEYGTAGIYSAELAAQRGVAVDVYRGGLEHNDRAILESNNVGFCKIVCKKGTDEILGCTIVAERAGEMINEVTLAMKNKIGLKAIGRNIHSYPTMGEAVMGCGVAYINAHWKVTLTKTLGLSSVDRQTTGDATPITLWDASDAEHREAAKKLNVWPLDEHNAALLNQVHPRGYEVSSFEPPHDVYDLIALGAGAGGLVSSRQSGRRGAKSAMISAHLAGGDCLNVGCVPSKAVLRAAKAIAEVRHCAEFGVVLPKGKVKIDFPTIMTRLRQKRALIAPADGHPGTEKAGAHVYQGFGKFTGPNTIQVGEKTLKFKKAVVATGGRPTLPNVPGLAEAPYTTNEVLFNLEVLPPRMVVLGAGVISLEMAQSFALFGSAVTVIQRTKKLFESKQGDPEGAEILQKELEKSGVKFVSGKIKQVKTLRARTNNPEELPLMSVSVTTDRGAVELKCECLLVATGRAANVENIGLEAAGVDFDPAKGVLVNDLAQSVSNPNVYAVGDCVADVPRLTHMSGEMAKLVVQNALFGDDWKLSSLVVPAVAYTEPEYGTAGIYSAELAAKEGIEVDVYRGGLEHNDRAILESNNVGFCKIICKKGTDEILGCTIVAERAGEMINEVTLAMKNKIGLKAIGRNIHSYPTMGEAVMGCGIGYINSHWKRLD